MFTLFMLFLCVIVHIMQSGKSLQLLCILPFDIGVCARRARLCVWIGLTNILFIDESMALQIFYYMELLMGSI